MKTLLTSLALVLSLNLPAAGADWTVLRPDENPSTRLTEVLREQVNAALDQRLERIEALRTPAQIRAYQRGQRENFLRNLGEHQAEKTPLNARRVGVIEGEGFTIEKLIYESRPGFYVTANFYRPHTPPPYPAVLVPCGHTANGKAGYQKVGLLLARNGIAALIYDPVGQGERKQILKRDAKGRLLPEGAIASSTVEHSVTGVAPILLGQGLATYRIWDGIRSLDYLASREDVDASKLGCTGNSGGGLMTSYLMALDDRIVAAAPGCYITTKRIKMERPGPGDAEQNIYSQIARGPDHPDLILMRAPRPTLILAATRDFVPIEGTWIAFRQAKRIYGKLGFPERVDLVEADEKHGFTQPLRVAMTRFMRRWLLGVDDAIVEGELPEFTDEQLQCAPRGQVLLLEGARSLADLYRERAAGLARARKDGIAPGLPVARRMEAYHPAVEVRGQTGEARKLLVRSVDGFPLPALRLPGRKGAGLPVLLISEAGNAAEMDGKDSAIKRFRKSGREIFAVDLRGFGETATRPWRAPAQYFGNNGAEFFLAYQLGRSLLEDRVCDALAAGRSLSELIGKGKFELLAVGAAGPVALHAAAAAPELFERVTTVKSIRSWQTVFDAPVTVRQLENVVHDAWRRYDLPDLVRRIGPDRVRQERSVDATGRPL